MDIALSDAKKEKFICYIDLLTSVINNTQPPNIPKDFDWEFICRNAQRNNVLNILGYAVNNLENKPDEQLIKVIENDRRYSILKETSQLFQVEKVLQEFEKAEIKNLPLKGYRIKSLYPRSDLRTMNDIDILVDKKDFKKTATIFENLGYTNKNILNSTEIHFTKDLLYFEIQSDLNSGDDTYYDNIWDKLTLRDDYNYSYNMTLEDFYIYMVYHCVNHFKSGGIGIRMVMDIYVFLKSYPDLDFEYVNGEFEKIGIITFAKRLKKLALNWFSRDKTEIDNFGEFVLYSSTYGTRDIHFFQSANRSKKGYLIKQIFIPYKSMKKQFPYLQKLPFLLPVSWVQYWFIRLFISRDINFKSGISDRITNLDQKNGGFVKNLMDELEIE